MFRTTTFLAFAVALLAGAAVASAAVVGVEFNHPNGGLNFSGNAGAAPDAGGTYFWNQLGVPSAFTTATSSSLFESDSSSLTTASVTLSRNDGLGSYYHAYGGFANELFSEYVYCGAGAPIDLSVDGLNPNGSYDVYVYSQPSIFTPYGSATTIGGTTQEAVSTMAGSFVPNDNYMLFSSVVADGAGSISAQLAPNSAATDEASINGVQIVGDFPLMEQEIGSGVINVDINAAGSATYSGQGAHPDPGNDYWNGVDAPGTNSAPLIESDGVTVSDATVTITGGGAYDAGADSGAPPAPFAADLFNDYSYVLGDNSVTFSIDNLVDGGLYDIYAYAGGAGWAGYGSQVTIGGETLTADYDPIPGDFVEGENYVVFRNVLAVDGTITGSHTGDPALGEGDLNGLTIVVVPEPSTIVLMIVGAVFLFVSRLRRK